MSTFVAPLGPQALEGDALEDAVQEWLVGLSGLDPTLVRPAWQPTPPAQPESATSWMAFRRGESRRSWDPTVQQVSSTDGSTPGQVVTRTEELEIALFFYGPGAGALYNRVSLGAAVDANAQVAGGSIRPITIGDPLETAEKIANQWLRRIDADVVLRRTVSSFYPVQELVSASVVLHTETRQATIPVPGPITEAPEQ